jgi:MinD superfamily P-loop ATPase
MRIAIASGKGGTGKTTVATNLAQILAQSGEDVCYLDCDVEEPNGHLFLRPCIQRTSSVTVPVPEVDMDKCTACGECSNICAYNAIACINRQILTFPGLCHGCGGCALVCEPRAIVERERTVGVIEEGWSDGISFVHGLLKIGEAMSPPVIRAVRQSAPKNTLQIIDAPPGTSCPVITAVQNTDILLLVTEPTPFGLWDLGLAVEMSRELNLPIGVVINRSEKGNVSAHKFCREHELPILAEIPDDRRVAEAYSRGELAIHAIPELVGLYQNLAQVLVERDPL